MPLKRIRSTLERFSLLPLSYPAEKVLTQPRRFSQCETTLSTGLSTDLSTAFPQGYSHIHKLSPSIPACARVKPRAGSLAWYEPACNPGETLRQPGYPLTVEKGAPCPFRGSVTSGYVLLQIKKMIELNPQCRKGAEGAI